VTESVRRLIVRLAAPSLLLAALLLGPGSVNAAGAAKPDGWIQLRTHCGYGKCTAQNKPWLGNNIYNSTGANQTATTKYYGTSLGVGEYDIYAVNIQNDGSVSGRIKVGAPSSSWLIKYYHGSTNITSAVVAGSYQTPSLAPGASYEITVKVDYDSMDGTNTRLITLTSSASSTSKDAVKLKMKFASCGC